jgi:hypothetical protein
VEYLVNVLFPILNGYVENIQYSLSEKLTEQSKKKIAPSFLWITKNFRTEDKPRYRIEDYLKDLVKKYPLDPSYLDAFYRALKYDDIDVSEVARVNMVETPHVPLEKLFKQSIIYLHVCKKYLIEKNIQCIVFLTGRGLFQRSLGIMARKLNIPTFYLCDALIPGDSLHIWDCENHASNDLKHVVLEPLTTTQEKEIKEFLDSQKNIKCISESPYDAASLTKKMKSFFILSYSRLFLSDKIFGNKGTLGLAKDEMMRKIRPFFAKKYYTTTSSEKLGKYVFLPYQIYYDLLLPLMWTEYTNIEYLADICVHALPEGYKLVVKEHPHFKGGTTLGELKRISQKENVVVVPVNANTQELMKNSSAVIVLCSNIGWQALMYHKPVIVLNSTSDKNFRFYYDDYGVTFNVSDPSQLSQVVQHALESQINSDTIDSFLYHVILKQHKKSEILCPVNYNKMNEGDNYHIVAQYVLKEMEKKGVL